MDPDPKKLEQARSADGTVSFRVGADGDDTDPRPGWSASTSAPEFQSLGKFVIVKNLGAGAFGRVYRARDTVLEVDVALKILRPGINPQSLIEEARRAAQLDHPNIVRVREAGEDPATGRHYIAMDFVEGKTLCQCMAEGTVKVRDVPAMMAQIADALAYANQTLVHRDLKPSNILIGDKGPMILDFGLALHDDEVAPQNEIAGTFSYMSPEQIRGKSDNLDGRTDIWSFGVILYQLLTGRLPFRGKGGRLFHQILSHEPKPPRQINPDIPETLERVCLDCLQKDVGRRPATAADLARRLRTLGPDRLVGRRRWLVATASLATCGVAAAWGWNRLSDRQSDAGKNLKGVEGAGEAGSSVGSQAAAHRVVLQELVFPPRTDSMIGIRDSGRSVQINVKGVSLWQAGAIGEDEHLALGIDIAPLGPPGAVGLFFGHRIQLAGPRAFYQTLQLYPNGDRAQVARTVMEYHQQTPHSPSTEHAVSASLLVGDGPLMLNATFQSGLLVQVELNGVPVENLSSPAESAAAFPSAEGTWGFYGLSSSALYSQLSINGIVHHLALED